MIRTLTSLSALALAATGLAQTAASEVYVSKNDRIVINGEIKEGDFDDFRFYAALMTYEDEPVIIQLNSPGGNVGEAMKIARLTNELWGYTAVDFLTGNDTVCDSACVLIFLSGGTRSYSHVRNYENGNLVSEFYSMGLHRPKFDVEMNAALSPAEAKAAYAELEQAYRDMLFEFGASDSFVQRIFRTPSHRMDRISEDELYEYFPKEAPWLDEYRAARCGEWTDADRAIVFEDSEAFKRRERLMKCVREMTIANQREVLADDLKIIADIYEAEQ